jgi:hypothetical protein
VRLRYIVKSLGSAGGPGNIVNSYRSRHRLKANRKPERFRLEVSGLLRRSGQREAAFSRVR